MKRMSCNPRFINNTGNGLVPGKIHTIRKNYDYWKTFEGQEVALFTWEGKAYRSSQIVFCTKKIVSVQRIEKETDGITPGSPFTFYRSPNEAYHEQLLINELAINDGFITESDFIDWFSDYPDVYMALVHFTDFKY